MTGLYIIFSLIIGVLTGGAIMYFYAKSKFVSTDSKGASFEEIIALKEDIAAKKEALKNLEARLQENKENQVEEYKKLQLEFENIASKIMEKSSVKLTEQNKLNIDAILTPLKEKIGDFEKTVQESTKESIAQHSALFTQLNTLRDINAQMSQEAKNLVSALKGENKTAGNWGELILEKVLEHSGLSKGREYVVQDSHTMEDHSRLQPDVVINLPDNKHIIIDSKVSLVDYERYANCEDELRDEFLKKFINSVKAHVKGLSEKKYQQLYNLESLDFVLMFIPIEPAFLLALQKDGNLYGFAYDKNIIIVSSTTLLATTRTIANIWQSEYQNRNVMEIATEAGNLYDKFQGFTEDLLKIGERMNQTKDSYDLAMNKLTSGKGNLINRAEKIKKLGAKTSKHIDERLVQKANEGIIQLSEGVDEK